MAINFASKPRTVLDGYHFDLFRSNAGRAKGLSCLHLARKVFLPDPNKLEACYELLSSGEIDKPVRNSKNNAHQATWWGFASCSLSRQNFHHVLWFQRRAATAPEENACKKLPILPSDDGRNKPFDGGTVRLCRQLGIGQPGL